MVRCTRRTRSRGGCCESGRPLRPLSTGSTPPAGVAQGHRAGAILLATPWVINPKLSGPSTGRVRTVEKTGFLVYHAKDGLAAALGKSGQSRVAQPAEVAEVRLALRRHDLLGARGTPMRPFGFAPGLNVLVVQVEALQHFAVGRVINGRSVAPFLTTLAKQNLY